ncbi:putative LRR receptor-like serine/threonine-protein kinase [Iris pallida]|uniref:LRR receptor-like serine/threonine-protein kinase n=1 Tax=Iris pallida TaxID=29817 RepID=A0AAX6FNC2_IRIPA|nr:putative LRR receptor-like serine/threonine-protein kinase [Iris pallida]
MRRQRTLLQSRRMPPWVASHRGQPAQLVRLQSRDGRPSQLPLLLQPRRRRRCEGRLLQKVALSSTPPSSSFTGGASSSQVVVAAVVYCFMPENAYAVAFAEVGGDTRRCCWTGRIELPYLVSDVIFFRGNLFVLNIEGGYQIIEPPSGPKPPRLAVASQIPPMFCSRRSYFTFVSSPSSGGHLLAVVGTRRLGFLVIKYNPLPSPRPWAQVTDLGDEALFLGGSYAMLLPAVAVAVARNSSSSSICARRNCIYITRNSDQGPLLEQRSLMNNSSSCWPLINSSSCWPLINKSSCWFLPSLS